MIDQFQQQPPRWGLRPILVAMVVVMKERKVKRKRTADPDAALAVAIEAMATLNAGRSALVAQSAIIQSGIVQSVVVAGAIVGAGAGVDVDVVVEVEVALRPHETRYSSSVPRMYSCIVAWEEDLAEALQWLQPAWDVQRLVRAAVSRSLWWAKTPQSVEEMPEEGQISRSECAPRSKRLLRQPLRGPIQPCPTPTPSARKILPLMPTQALEVALLMKQ